MFEGLKNLFGGKPSAEDSDKIEWKELENVKTIDPPKYMMATAAFHKMGDVSADKPQLCSVTRETDEYYVGTFILGPGLIDIHFPKETTRELTEEEKKEWNNKPIYINGTERFKVDLD